MSCKTHNALHGRRVLSVGKLSLNTLHLNHFISTSTSSERIQDVFVTVKTVGHKRVRPALQPHALSSGPEYSYNLYF